MFDVRGKAELRHINVRAEAHGDEMVPAVDVKLMLIGVPVDRITSAVPDMAVRFYDGDTVAVGEVNPLTVHHKLENLAVTIDDLNFKGCDIKKGMKITLQPGKIADVECSVQIQGIGDSVAPLIRKLRDEVSVKVVERQLKLAGMDQ